MKRPCVEHDGATKIFSKIEYLHTRFYSVLSTVFIYSCEGFLRLDLSLRQKQKFGVAGLEPADAGTKNRCLTNLAIPHQRRTIERIRLADVNVSFHVLTHEITFSFAAS